MEDSRLMSPRHRRIFNCGVHSWRPEFPSPRPFPEGEGEASAFLNKERVLRFPHESVGGSLSLGERQGEGNSSPKKAAALRFPAQYS
jgi:hypothetical protein